MSTPLPFWRKLLLGLCVFVLVFAGVALRKAPWREWLASRQQTGPVVITEENQFRAACVPIAQERLQVCSEVATAYCDCLHSQGAISLSTPQWHRLLGYATGVYPTIGDTVQQVEAFCRK